MRIHGEAAEEREEASGVGERAKSLPPARLELEIFNAHTLKIIKMH